MSGSKEGDIQHSIRLDCGRQPGVVLYRNNVGNATYERNGRTWRVPYGLTEGASDLIGWRSITITPEMVGQRVAVFTAIEVKADAGKTQKRRRELQQLFLDLVQRAGGFSGRAKSAREARSILGIE